MTKPSILFDMDDTLLATSVIYDEARVKFALHMTTLFPLSQGEVETLFTEIDLAGARAEGFGRHRFPASMEATYGKLLSIHRPDHAPDLGVVRRVRRYGYAVYQTRAQLLPHALATLEHLAQSHDLLLYTMGDAQVQQRRIRLAGLAPYFRQVVIPERKDTGTLQRTLERFGLDPATTWSVGNSITSDVRPALACGLLTVHYNRPTWGYDNAAQPTGHYEIRDLVELAPLVRRVERGMPVGLQFGG